LIDKRNNIEIIDIPLSAFDKAIEVLIAVLLVFMPLAFGAVEAWSEEVVIILAAAVFVCFLLKIITQKNTQVIWSWSYLPIALFILVAVFQLVPMSAGLVSTVSPNTEATKRELLSDLPNAAEILKSIVLSFYPNATKHDLRILLALSTVFFVVVNTYRRPDQVKRLLGTIAVIGGSIALLALAQDLFDNGKIYWFVPAGSGKANSAAFVNHSHYGQFMNLSIGAALGLIMVKFHEAFTGRKATPSYIIEFISSPEAKIIWFLLAIVIIGIATVFVSLTRGGMVSMLIAAGFTTLILSSRHSLRGRGWIMVLLALGAFICVLYVGFDAVYDRLATLQQINEFNGRWQIVKDIATAWTKFPIFGTGLGTHEVVYPMFDRATVTSLASHAENEYAQAAEETGIAGLLLLIAFGILVWFSYARNIRTSNTPLRSAAYGLGFGLAAITIHSFSDFGQHILSNAFLSVISCALLIGLAHTDRKNLQPIQAAKTNKSLRAVFITILFLISPVWLWAINDANNARLAESSWANVSAAEKVLSEQEHQPTDIDYKNLISSAARAADYQPDNIKYQHGLNVYRWYAMSRNTDPNTGNLIIPRQALPVVEKIVDEFHKARLLCPTYGVTYCVVGQLEYFILNDPNGAGNIAKGYKLAPSDPTACFVAGLLDINQQHIEESYEKLSRAVSLDGRFFADAADLYINQADRPDLAIALAGDNSSYLSYAANILSACDNPQKKEIIDAARNRIVELLKEKCSRPDAPASALASLANIYIKENDPNAAIENYRRALALDYGQVQWRFTLAKLLAGKGMVSDAIYEARICLRLRPQFTAAQKLIADLSVLPAAELRSENIP
jgi:O-antigen ligase/tetratricopeptide (TPR) repeat protein